MKLSLLQILGTPSPQSDEKGEPKITYTGTGVAVGAGVVVWVGVGGMGVKVDVGITVSVGMGVTIGTQEAKMRVTRKMVTNIFVFIAL